MTNRAEKLVFALNKASSLNAAARFALHQGKADALQAAAAAALIPAIHSWLTRPKEERSMDAVRRGFKGGVKDALPSAIAAGAFGAGAGYLAGRKRYSGVTGHLRAAGEAATRGTAGFVKRRVLGVPAPLHRLSFKTLHRLHTLRSAAKKWWS